MHPKLRANELRTHIPLDPHSKFAKNSKSLGTFPRQKTKRFYLVILNFDTPH
jgi:hypothetical protein